MVIDFSIVNGWLILTNENEWGIITRVFLLSDTHRPLTYRRYLAQRDSEASLAFVKAKEWALNHDPLYPQTSDQVLEIS